MSGSEDAAADDRLRRRVLWALPTGLYLLGTRAGGRRNLMTVSWVTQVATAPRLVAVGVEAASVTRALLDEGGVFALSLLRRDDRAVVRRFVKPVDPADVHVDDVSGAGTMRDLPVVATATGAPVLAGAAGWLDCTVRAAHPLGSHVLYVGEVVGVGWADGEEPTPLLRMEDTRMSYGG